MDGFRTTESDTSSQTSWLTHPNSNVSPQQDSLLTEPMSTEWTNEKHSLYLKSIETSFVNELYESMDLGWRVQKEVSEMTLSAPGHCRNCTPSGQFNVLRRGSWQRINFQRARQEKNVVKENHDLLTCPWIQRFRPTRKPRIVPCPSGDQKSGEKASGTSDSVPFPARLHDQDMVDSKKVPAEVSDQNFDDEDVKDEKASSASGSKRIKTTDASNSDQVVPCGKPSFKEEGD